MKSLVMSSVLVLMGLFGSNCFAHNSGAHPDQHLVFSNNIHAHLFWEAGPAESIESVLRIEFMNGVDHTPLEIQATPSVDTFMPSMGHGSAPTAIQRVLDTNGQPKPGVYRVSNIYFVMGGAWDVHVNLKKVDNTTETQTFSVTIGADGDDGSDDEGGMHQH